MKTKQAYLLVQDYLKLCVPTSTFAEALCITTGALDKRFQREQELKYDEAFMLAKFFKLPTRLFFTAKSLPRTLTIDYYENGKITLKRNSNVPNYCMDFEMAYKYRRNSGPKDFKIMCMIGNKLNGGQLWIKDEDLILLDVTYKDCESPGMYAYECNNGTYVAMAYIEKRMNNEYAFMYFDGSETQMRSQEFLDKAKFKIIGRIIKNLFFFT